MPDAKGQPQGDEPTDTGIAVGASVLAQLCSMSDGRETQRGCDRCRTSESPQNNPLHMSAVSWSELCMCIELTAHTKWPNGFRFGRHRPDGYVRIETRVSHRSHRRPWQPSSNDVAA